MHLSSHHFLSLDAQHLLKRNHLPPLCINKDQHVTGTVLSCTLYIHGGAAANRESRSTASQFTGVAFAEAPLWKRCTRPAAELRLLESCPLCRVFHEPSAITRFHFQAISFRHPTGSTGRPFAAFAPPFEASAATSALAARAATCCHCTLDAGKGPETDRT